MMLLRSLPMLCLLAALQSPAAAQTAPVRPGPRPPGPELQSPVLAFGMSFLIPGTGQLYNGQVLKGVVQTGLFAAGLVVMLTMGTESSYSSSAYTDYSYYGTFTYYRSSTEEELSTMFYVGAGVAAATWLWSVIDAPIAASAINSRRIARHARGLALETGPAGHTLCLDVGPARRGLALRAALYF